MSVVSGSLSVVCPVPVRFLVRSLSVGCPVPSLSFVRRSPLIPDMKEPPPSGDFESAVAGGKYLSVSSGREGGPFRTRTRTRTAGGCGQGGGGGLVAVAA